MSVEYGVVKADSKRPGRPDLKKCKTCRKQFTVRVGSIFEDSKIPLRKWLMAIRLMSHYGIHHHFSKHHLHRYCDERSFMWDNRKVSDGERMVAAIVGAEGKRLYYREPVEAS